jgi:hypothetical protein
MNNNPYLPQVLDAAYAPVGISEYISPFLGNSMPEMVSPMERNSYQPPVEDPVFAQLKNAATIQTKEAQIAPIRFDWDKSNADRYVQSNYYKELGFDPFSADNEEKYASRQTMGDIMGNAFAGSWKLGSQTFVDGWKGWGRAFDALFSWDASKLMGSAESLAELHKEQEAIMNKYAIFMSKEAEESIFSRQFFGNMIQQGGFMMGAMAQFLSEEMLTLGAAKFLKPIVGGASMARTMKKMYDVAENTKDLKRIGDTWTQSAFINSAYKAMKSAIPMANTASKMKGAYNAGAGVKQLAYIGVGGLKRAFSEANLAMTEARMEAAGTYGDLKERMMDQYESRHGYKPTGAELDKIEGLAQSAAWTNFKVNSAVLGVMNRIQFDNVFSKFNPDRLLFKKSMLDAAQEGGTKALSVTGKIDGKMVTRPYELGRFGRIGASGQIAKDFGKKKAAWEVTKSIGSGLMKWEGSEGLQELIQEGSNVGVQDYYYDLYTKGKASFSDSFGAGVESQKNLQGIKTFLTGAMTGRVMSPITKGIETGMHYVSTTKKQREEQAQSTKEALDEITLFYANPAEVLKEQVANLKVQGKAADSMEEALKNGDKYHYENVKDSAFAKAVASAKKLDMLPSFLDTIKKYGEHFDAKEFQEAFGVSFNETNRKNVKEYMGKIAADIKEYDETYTRLKEKFSDVIMPELFEAGSKGQMQALFAQKVVNDAIEVLATNHYKAKRSYSRMMDIQNKAASNQNFGGVMADAFRTLSSVDNLKAEITQIEQELKSYDKTDAQDQKTKERLKERQNQLSALKAWSEYHTDFNLNERVEKEMSDKAKTALFDYLNARGKTDGYQQVALDQESVDEQMNMMEDYVKLNRDAQSFTDAFNAVANPYQFRQFYNRMQSGARMAVNAAKVDAINEALSKKLGFKEKHQDLLDEYEAIQKKEEPTLEDYDRSTEIMNEIAEKADAYDDTEERKKFEEWKTLEFPKTRVGTKFLEFLEDLGMMVREASTQEELEEIQEEINNLKQAYDQQALALYELELRNREQAGATATTTPEGTTTTTETPAGSAAGSGNENTETEGDGSEVVKVAMDSPEFVTPYNALLEELNEELPKFIATNPTPEQFKLKIEEYRSKMIKGPLKMLSPEDFATIMADQNEAFIKFIQEYNEKYESLNPNSKTDAIVGSLPLTELSLPILSHLNQVDTDILPEAITHLGKKVDEKIIETDQKLEQKDAPVDSALGKSIAQFEAQKEMIAESVASFEGASQKIKETVDEVSLQVDIPKNFSTKANRGIQNISFEPGYTEAQQIAVEHLKTAGMISENDPFYTAYVTRPSLKTASALINAAVGRIYMVELNKLINDFLKTGNKQALKAEYEKYLENIIEDKAKRKALAESRMAQINVTSGAQKVNGPLLQNMAAAQKHTYKVLEQIADIKQRVVITGTDGGFKVFDTSNIKNPNAGTTIDVRRDSDDKYDIIAEEGVDRWNTRVSISDSSYSFRIKDKKSGELFYVVGLNSPVTGSGLDNQRNGSLFISVKDDGNLPADIRTILERQLIERVETLVKERPKTFAPLPQSFVDKVNAKYEALLKQDQAAVPQPTTPTQKGQTGRDEIFAILELPETAIITDKQFKALRAYRNAVGKYEENSRALKTIEDFFSEEDLSKQSKKSVLKHLKGESEAEKAQAFVMMNAEIEKLQAHVDNNDFEALQIEMAHIIDVYATRFANGTVKVSSATILEPYILSRLKEPAGTPAQLDQAQLDQLITNPKPVNPTTRTQVKERMQQIKSELMESAAKVKGVKRTIDTSLPTIEVIQYDPPAKVISGGRPKMNGDIRTVAELRDEYNANEKGEIRIVHALAVIAHSDFSTDSEKQLAAQLLDHFSPEDVMLADDTTDTGYDADLDQVLINFNQLGDSEKGQGAPVENVILHELMHKLTVKELQNPNSAFTKKMQMLYKVAKKEMMADRQSYYAFEVEKEGTMDHLAEFVAEAFTNPAFQQSMSRIDFANSNKTLWEKFMDAVRELTAYLGLKVNNTLLAEVIGVTTAQIEKQTAAKKGEEAKRQADAHFASFEKFLEELPKLQTAKEVQELGMRAMETLKDSSTLESLLQAVVRRMKELKAKDKKSKLTGLKQITLLGKNYYLRINKAGNLDILRATRGGYTKVTPKTKDYQKLLMDLFEKADPSDLFTKKVITMIQGIYDNRADIEDIQNQMTRAVNKKAELTLEERKKPILDHDAYSIEEEILQFFIAGGQLATKDFTHMTGFGSKSRRTGKNQGGSELFAYGWAVSPKGQLMDAMSQTMADKWNMEQDEVQELIMYYLSSYPTKTHMVEAAEAMNNPVERYQEPADLGDRIEETRLAFANALTDRFKVKVNQGTADQLFKKIVGETPTEEPAGGAPVVTGQPPVTTGGKPKFTIIQTPFDNSNAGFDFVGKSGTGAWNKSPMRSTANDITQTTDDEGRTREVEREDFSNHYSKVRFVINRLFENGKWKGKHVSIIADNSDYRWDGSEAFPSEESLIGYISDEEGNAIIFDKTGVPVRRVRPENIRDAKMNADAGEQIVYFSIIEKEKKGGMTDFAKLTAVREQVKLGIQHIAPIEGISQGVMNIGKQATASRAVQSNTMPNTSVGTLAEDVKQSHVSLKVDTESLYFKKAGTAYLEITDAHGVITREALFPPDTKQIMFTDSEGNQKPLVDYVVDLMEVRHQMNQRKKDGTLSADEFFEMNKKLVEFLNKMLWATGERYGLHFTLDYQYDGTSDFSSVKVGNKGKEVTKLSLFTQKDGQYIRNEDQVTILRSLIAGRKLTVSKDLLDKNVEIPYIGLQNGEKIVTFVMRPYEDFVLQDIGLYSYVAHVPAQNQIERYNSIVKFAEPKPLQKPSENVEPAVSVSTLTENPEAAKVNTVEPGPTSTTDKFKKLKGRKFFYPLTEKLFEKKCQ